MLTSDQKGAIAETAIVHAAVKLGVVVLKPVNEGGRYDLVFDVGGRLLRIQCKWAQRRGAVIVVNCQSARRTRDGFARRAYTREEVDAIAAYCAALERCFLLPPDLFDRRRAIQLRVYPTLNNQQLRINWAERYEFDARLRAIRGAVAQLGERRLGMAEVTGSSPVGSTSSEAQTGAVTQKSSHPISTRGGT